MAHSLSAKKRVRQNLRQRARNRARKSMLKTMLHKREESILRGTLEQAESAVHDAVRVLDRAGCRRTIHPNAAARRKSRLTRKLNALRQKAGTPG